ncbi:hypothetical protein OG195_44870 (plasmid) [Streptomyces sp. NBC_01362]|uniref:hypothetical protein n=1 Tax=Streptomyces sp. NBC_01362 TaxID=2903839 RepID=UPI002E3605A1|nr:hypothetical protein [Streptomyces sp. NBC_01362]
MNTTLTPRAGVADEVGREIGREDDRSGNGSGYERDETDTSFYQLIRHMVATGDIHARAVGRRACRTYADMVPGAYDRQPVLHMTTATITFMASQPCQSVGRRARRPLPMRAANDACGICGRWGCDGTNCPPRLAPAAHGLGGSGVAR